jgi:hypothetical protein
MVEHPTIDGVPMEHAEYSRMWICLYRSARCWCALPWSIAVTRRDAIYLFEREWGDWRRQRRKGQVKCVPFDLHAGIVAAGSGRVRRT